MARTFKQTFYAGLASAALLFCLALSTDAFGQASNGKVTTAAPTYTNNTLAPLSLDANGNLRVVSSGGGGGTSDTNLVEIGGNAVTVTTPGVLDVNVVSSSSGGAVDVTDIGGVPVVSTTPGTFDVTCIAGCVAGAGVINAEVTAAPPSYSPGNEPVTQDAAGNLRVTLTTALPTGTNNIGDVDAVQSGAWSVDAVQSGAWSVSLAAGTNNIGDVDVLSLPPIPAGSNAIGTVTAVDATTSNFSLIATAGTNSTSIKASAGELLELTTYNTGATVAWVKLYNSGTAPTCGTGTPEARYMIPGAPSGGAGSNVVIPMGKNFSSGIGMCITTGIDDADTGAVAATTFVVNATFR